MMGREDPFLTVGEENDRTVKSNSKYVWALKDINFEVEQGEVLGIIGKNGAGKSTLLKILSRTTGPTKGSVKMKGRIASLLEVGTGFHGELSGRENIYLNGAIMGMKKVEIKAKLDEIIDFAGVEKYIDTPVKRYSSGMYVRLAFGVAAHLEPDIMIVDEVLAVGDAEFQKKALGKMKDVSSKGGRTVLFVSHNMISVKSLCERGIWLEHGRVKDIGNVETVVDQYLSTATLKTDSFIRIEKESKGFTVHSIKISDNGFSGNFNIESDLAFEIEVSSIRVHETININIFFKTREGVIIFATCSPKEKFHVGKYKYQCRIPAGTLNDNIYFVDLMVVENGPKMLHHLEDVMNIEGIEAKRDSSWLGKFPGMIKPTNFHWIKNIISE